MNNTHLISGRPKLNMNDINIPLVYQLCVSGLVEDLLNFITHFTNK